MRPRDRLALIFAVSVLAVAPFALGGAPRWAICVTSLLSAACAASFVTSKREMTAISPLLVFLALASGLTLLQVVPLPAGLVEILSPGKAQLVRDNTRALGVDAPSWLALSLDPPATLLELAKLLGYLAFGYAALRLSATPARRQWLVAVVAAVGAAMAITTLLHLAVGADTLFGIYRPRQALVRPTLAPLLNQNHLAALMALCAPMALGLAGTATGRQRVGWLAVLCLCAGVGLLSESRGGAIALVIGLATVGVLSWLQKRGAPQASRLKRADMVGIAVVAMSCLVLVGVFTAGGVARDLSGTRVGELSRAGSKFQVWRETSPLISEYRWTGVGRGGFEGVSTRIHDSSSFTFPHVENEYLQAVVDWGFIGAGALALVLIWLATVAARNARTTTWEAGAFAGLVALAVENFTDFSLWMPGLAYPAVAVAAALSWPSVDTKAPLRRLWLPVRTAGIAVVLVATTLAASPLGRQASDETAALARGGPKPDLARATATWKRHPSDFAAAGHVARALFSARDRRAISVANRALVLHPTSGDLHRLVAHMLIASGNSDQARVEFALALKYKPRGEVLDEILAAFPRDDDVIRALPLVPSMVKEWADRLIQKKRVPAALGYLQRYLSLYPDDARLQLHAAEVALGTGQAPLALGFADRAYAIDPTPAAIIMAAKVATQLGQTERALGLLRSELDHPKLPMGHTERVDVLLTLAEIQTTQRTFDAARETLRTALNLAEGRQLAQVHRHLGDVEELLGNAHQAAWERQRAVELER